MIIIFSSNIIGEIQSEAHCYRCMVIITRPKDIGLLGREYTILC